MSMVTQKAIFKDGRIVEGPNAQVLINILGYTNPYGVKFEDAPKVKNTKKELDAHSKRMKEKDLAYVWNVANVDPYDRMENETEEMKEYYHLHNKYVMAVHQAEAANKTNPFVELFSETSYMQSRFDPDPSLVIEVYNAIITGELTEDSDPLRE